MAATDTICALLIEEEFALALENECFIGFCRLTVDIYYKPWGINLNVIS